MHTESKRKEKNFIQIGIKIAEVAIHISDKIDFNTKAIVGDKELSNSTSWYLSKEAENTKLKRHMHPYVNSSITYNT